jgi:hypothetical protein
VLTRFPTVVWLVCLVVLYGSVVCAQEQSEELDFFENKVRPLLVESCYECHAGEERSGGLLLDSRDGWMAGGDSGPGLIPGDLENSLLIEAVRYGNHNLQMPPDGRLSDADIAVFEQWVLRGATDPRRKPVDPPDTDDSSEEASASIKPTGMTIDDGLKFWSFRPVARPDVPQTAPQTTTSDWVQTPVDAFVLDQLESVGLTPAPPADRRVLIRRATYDLIGLPPTPVEVDAFLADDSADAFECLVERLLASPQYGERWGRHWLDVARYADSNGLDENLAYGNAWRYRDYVVSAFNKDKPYDRFLIEQIAGDLLPEANRETLTATGFLVLGAKVLAEPDKEKLVMDTVDEQIDTVGKAFMGMTLGCTRCHDHKFDPILQSDYYSLAAIFKSTRTFGDTVTGNVKHWNEKSFATAEELERLAEIDKAITAKRDAAYHLKYKASEELRKAATRDAAKYLAAAAQFAPSASLREVEAIALPLGLHPRILHHCRLHLEFHREDPFLAEWYELVASGSTPAEIERHFQTLFDLVRSTKPADRAGEVDAATPRPPSPPPNPRIEHARQALEDRVGFIAVPTQPQHAFDPQTLAEYVGLMDEARLFESKAPDETAVMAVGEAKTLVSLPIHIRGSHHNLGEPVPRAFPQVMRTSTVRPVLPRNHSGRLELARWMAATEHPLTARVIVNRVWGWHFGNGLVGTTENFGVLGDRPTHPELLDWLAHDFMESGWSIKELHRLLLRSSVYQMSSTHPDESHTNEIDPENRRLWKFSRQRLEVEQIRDAMLAISGGLEESIGGKNLPFRN